MRSLESFEEISRRQARLSPVFVTGVPRSGTTVFFHILQRHPSLTVRAAAPGQYGLESAAFRRSELLAQGELLESFRRFMVADSKRIEEMRAMIARIPRRSRRLYRAACRSGVLRGLAWKRVGYHHVVRVFFHFAQLARETDRLLEKTPDHSLCLPEIWATYPNAAVFFLYRHPVNVFASYRKRLEFDLARGHSEERVRWLRVSPDEFARSYDSRLREAWRFGRRHPERFMLIRYESLISDTATILGGACDLLDLPPEVELMMAGAEERGGASPLGPISANAVPWEDFVERREARIIETALGHRFEALGFERYS